MNFRNKASNEGGQNIIKVKFKDGTLVVSINFFMFMFQHFKFFIFRDQKKMFHKKALYRKGK